MLQIFARPLLLSGACYVAIKGSEYLCTRPVINDGRIPTIFERVRISCASMYEYFVREIGRRQWQEMSEVIFKNAWISVFATALWVQGASYVLYDSTVRSCGFDLYSYMIFQEIVNKTNFMRELSNHLIDSADRIARWITPQVGTEQAMEKRREQIELVDFLETGRLAQIPAFCESIFPVKCLITGNAIRTVVVPNLGAEIPGMPKYEKTEFLKWMREKPNEAPPGWPVDRLPLPLREGYYIGDEEAQRTINRSIYTYATTCRQNLLIGG